jgi:hypothetical protein
MSTSKRLISLALCSLLGLGSTTALAQEGGEAEGEEGAEPMGEETPEDADGTPVVVAPTQKRQWGVGARLRYIFMPRSVTELFVDKATSLNSVGFGAEIVTRKGNFDIVFGLEYDSLAAKSGLYQDKGDDPARCTGQAGGDADQCPDFREFDSFGMVSVDASFIWHTDITEKIQLRYGAGIGLGLMTGKMDVTKTTSCPAGTTLDDLDNSGVCTRAPTTEEEDDVPPVLPILNFLVGTRFMLADNIAFNVETGFRDIFYLGAGFSYTL